MGSFKKAVSKKLANLRKKLNKLWCNVTPTRVRNAKKRSEDREPTIVDLRPFTAKAIVTFEDVPVTKSAKRIITVLNPFKETLRVSVTKKPNPEFNVALEWLENTISAEGSVDLELIWVPPKVVGTRETLDIVDQFGNKKSVAIILKSCALKATAPRRTGLNTKQLHLKSAPPPKNVQPLIRQVKRTYSEEFAVENYVVEPRAISPVKKPQMSVMPSKSPLRNATNIRTYSIREEVNITPKNASALFNDIKFTPQTETKPKGESKLDALASMPTPVAVKRDDIVVDERKTEIVAVRNFSQEVEALLETPQIVSRENVQKFDQVIIETPSRKLSTLHMGKLVEKMVIEEEEGDDDVFASTYVKGPCEIDEIEIAIVNDTHVINKRESTFKVRKSTSFSEQIETDFEIHQRQFSESMRVEHEGDKIHLAVQGSMPNLCDERVMPIEQNRYYLNVHGEGQNVQNLSVESIVSTGDFNELQFCATSSCLNLHEIGRSPKGSTRSRESPLRQVPVVSPIIKRVRTQSPQSANTVMVFSPGRRLKDDLQDIQRRETFTVKQKQPTKSPHIFKVPKSRFDYRGSAINIRSASMTSLSSSTTSIASTCSMPATNGRLYNENIINSYSVRDPFSATTTEDPFLSSSMYLDDRKLEEIEKSLMKWLNALVTIPPDLETKRDEKIDVAKLFNDVQNKDLTIAPSKEIVCSQYYTARLDSLRSAAVKFFHSEEISKTLNKLAVVINEKKLLEVHSARFIHLDLVLQRGLLELLLCFNPLWLRIGLEVVFNVQLNLHSNHDIFGMSRFIINNMFKSDYLKQKYGKYHQQNELVDKLRKYTAKNFLFILFFLDHAKEAKLIKQNPCLFMKTAPYKDSNEILKKFASLVLANYGDILRMMKRLNYSLSHKQTVIDEYDYAFKNLAVDLRDGVRLTKVMEIILLRDDLVKRVRVPAISRLQKVHNVELALKALEQAEYKINGNITAKDIADGHREKTLSLLWQIIYVFRAPRFNAAATVIQKFWRARWLKVFINRRIQIKEEERRANAAIVIQKYFRGWKSRRDTKIYRERVEKSVVTFQRFTRGFLARRKVKVMKSAVHTIERWFLRVKQVRQVQQEYQRTRNAIIKIQIWWRRQLLARKLIATANFIREIRNEKNQAAMKVQKYFRGYQKMKIDRETYQSERNAIIKLQRRFRGKLLTKSIQRHYQLQKSSAILIQRKWRATKEMRVQRMQFLQQKSAALTIQTIFRGYLIMKVERYEFLQMRKSAIVIQTRFRALKAMKVQRNEFMMQKTAAIKIQKFYRGFKQMQQNRAQFLTAKSAIVKIQRRFRGKLLMQKDRREFVEKKIAAVMIQQIWRATLLMRVERAAYQENYRKIVFIQQTYKAKLLMRKERDNYLKIKAAAITLQRRLRAHNEMLKARNEHIKLKQSVLKIEQRYIALRLMRAQRAEYEKLKASTIAIQRWYRNIKFGENIQEHYVDMKMASIRIQKWWRQQLLARKIVLVSRIIVEMRAERLRKENEAAVKVQKYFRGFLQMKREREEFLAKKKVVIKIQHRFRSLQLTRKAQNDYQHTRTTIIKIQQRWRATLAMRQQKVEYQNALNRIVFVQRRFRANQEMKMARNEFISQKNAAIKIQDYFRRYLVMRELRMRFLKIREATITIQKHFRGYLQMKKDREEYLHTLSTVVKIQQIFRSKMIMRCEQHEYQLKRSCTIKIQKFWRGFLLMRQQRGEYQASVQGIIFVQRRFRAKIAGRKARNDFIALKLAAVVIQRRFRAKLAMIKARNEYISLKKAVLTVENRFIATKLAEKEREIFLNYRDTVILVQQRFRLKLEARKLHKNYQQTRKSIAGLQRHARGFLARRYFREVLQTPENLENRKKHRAARRIQAAWRGYKERSKKSNYCFRAIVQRLIIVSKNKDPTQTLAHKLKTSLDFLKGRYDASVAINTLVRIEYMSRTVPWILTDDAEFISAFCYGLMAQAIRSEIDKQIIELCSCIILNLGRYHGTKEDAFQESGLMTIANMLQRWCDKDCGIFNTLCTLIWVFSHCDKKKGIIRDFMTNGDGMKIMQQIKVLVARKENMRRNSSRPIGFQSISLVKYKKDHQLQAGHQPNITIYSSGYITKDLMQQCRQLPTLEPDYGVVRMHPYIFYSSVFAFETILSSLDIHSIK